MLLTLDERERQKKKERAEYTELLQEWEKEQQETVLLVRRLHEMERKEREHR